MRADRSIFLGGGAGIMTMARYRAVDGLAVVVLVAAGWAGLAGCAGGSGMKTGMGGTSAQRLRQQVRAVLAAGVNSPDAATRSHALESLAVLGGLETPGLIRRHLYDPSAAVRFAAGMAAGDIQDHSARSMLEILLRDKNVSVQLASAYALEKLGDDRFGGWYDHVLAGEDPQLCGQACMLLGRLGETATRRDSRAKLWHVLKQTDQATSVRLQAAEALARLGDETVVERLLAFAGSRYADDRLLAISGLEQLGGANAFAMLTVLAGDPQIEVRLAAYRALGPEVDEHNLAEVRQSLSYKDEAGDAVATARVRGLAAFALGRLGEQQDTSLLSRAMQSDSDYVRMAAARAGVEFLQRRRGPVPVRGM